MAISGTYYIDTADFSTATAVWTDTALTIKAADGYYAFGGNYRQQFEGLLLPITTCSGAPTNTIVRVGDCIPNQINSSYTISGTSGDVVVVKATFTGQFTASSNGSSAVVTIGTSTQATSCYYSGNQFFTLNPTYTFTMTGSSQNVDLAAVVYEADETLTTVTVEIVSVNGIASGASVNGCRGDSTGGPC